jgi:predicted small secreted protein
MAGFSPCADVHRMNKKHFSFLILITAFIGLLNSGCRTMEGAGEDVERAGEKIQEKADR